MKLADSKTIRDVDRTAMQRYGVSGLQLMENAGRGLAECIESYLARVERAWTPKVAIIAGKGNNGGDGFVAARHLANRGLKVEVYLLAALADLKGDAGANARAWKNMGGAVHLVRSRRSLEKHAQSFKHASVVVDAILGTGLSSPVKGFYGEVIDFINTLARPVISVDVPSGVDASTGAELASAVRADLTVTMAMPKLGLYLYPGRELAGDVEVVDIGAPATLVRDDSIRWNLTTGGLVAGYLSPRGRNTHKGTYGHVLVVGGSTGKTGAVFMAATAAMRSGAGLATIALPETLNPAMEAKTTEVMTVPLADPGGGVLGRVSVDGVKEAMKDKAAVVLGPGLGSGAENRDFVREAVKACSAPLVVDADGLNCLFEDVVLVKRRKAPTVLTPHPGEMSTLLGVPVSEVQADRVGSAEELARRARSTVVLKGASTVIADPTGPVYVNPTGNAGLASAGTGDVLSGMVGAFLAQGLSTVEASVAAVYVHGLIADAVAEERGEIGLMATDLLPLIPVELNRLAEGC